MAVAKINCLKGDRFKMGKNFIAADIGTSETRISVDGALVLRIPNNCVFITEPTPESFPAGEGLLGSLEAVIEGLEENPVAVLFGEMASRYSANNQRPTPLEAKHKQYINIVSIIIGAALGKLERNHNNSTPVDLHIALPPVEVSKARRVLESSLGGEYRVEFPKLKRAARVKFDNIYCYEESRMAGEAFMDQLPEAYKQGTVLSVDIGAGTTDLALFINGIFYERSAKTYKIGGNTAREFLIDDITAEYDYELPIGEAEEVISTGLLRLGNIKVSVVENVNAAKAEFAETLVNSIQQYFRAVNVPIQSVNAFLLSGGGSLSSSIEGSRSVASFVVDALKSVCPSIDTVEYKGDARLANLDGLCKMAQSENSEGPVKPVTPSGMKETPASAKEATPPAAAKEATPTTDGVTE